MATPRTPPIEDRPKPSRAEAVARAIEAEIESGCLPVGHRLGTKDDLRTRFAVAPATLNEALRILDIKGVISARPGPGGGVFRAAPSGRPLHGSLGLDVDADATLAEWREIRDSLEAPVCRKAARRCSSRDAATLRGTIAEMATPAIAASTFMALHWKLHRQLARIGDNPPMTQLYERLLDIMEDAVQQEIANDPLYDPPVNLEIHEQLVEAVIAGRAREVEAAIRRHTPGGTR